LGPFIDSTLVRMLTSLFLSLLMVAGVANMSPRRGVRFGAGLVAFAAIILRWMTHIMPGPAILLGSSCTSLFFMALLTLGILYKVFSNDKPVTSHRIRGAVAAYLLFGITWSILYGILDQTLTQAFNVPAASGLYGPDRQEQLTYFSFVTLATLGYGDITPIHGVSRMFAIMEAMIGQLYPATLLARLVSLEVSHRSGDRAPPSIPPIP
ncbi:two pore domain potassium channel family protein, partial [bacterium]